MSVIQLVDAASVVHGKRIAWEERCAAKLCAHGMLLEEAFEHAADLRSKHGLACSPEAAAIEALTRLGWLHGDDLTD